MKLRHYQQKIIDKIKKYLKEGHTSIAVQAPTGAGKTVIFSYIAKNALLKGSKVLILTDRIELLTETGGTLSDFNIEFDTITAGQKYPNTKKSCIVGMSQTLKKRINHKDYPKAWNKFFASFDIVICDEAHKQEFNPFFEANNLFNGAIRLGFSATPQRSGKMRQLAEDYTQIVHGPTTMELIELGFLVKDEYYYAKGIETKGLKKDSKGDYAESDQFARFNRPELYGDAVKAWREHAENTVTLVFCVNIQHSIETCKAFNNAGIKAKFLTSDVSRPKLPDNPTPGQLSRYERHLEEHNNWKEAYKLYSGPRDTVLNKWKSGEFYVLINAGILTTGFNFKPIETIQVLRVTLSDPLWLQICGRGSRTYEGPHPVTGEHFKKEHFNIIDHGSHGYRLGMYRTPRKYNLIHAEIKGGGAAPVKECGAKKRKDVKQDPMTGYYPDKDGRPGCGSYLASSVMICPYCGYKYDTDKEIAEAEFAKYEYEIEPAPNMHLKNVDQIDEIMQEAESKGYKDGWAVRRIAHKFGRQGLNDYARKMKYNSFWVQRTAQRLGVKSA